MKENFCFQVFSGQFAWARNIQLFPHRKQDISIRRPPTPNEKIKWDWWDAYQNRNSVDTKLLLLLPPRTIIHLISFQQSILAHKQCQKASNKTIIMEAIHGTNLNVERASAARNKKRDSRAAIKASRSSTFSSIIASPTSSLLIIDFSKGLKWLNFVTNFKSSNKNFF